MNKRSLSVLLVILLSVLVLSIAATCSFCGISITEEDSDQPGIDITGQDSENSIISESSGSNDNDTISSQDSSQSSQSSQQGSSEDVQDDDDSSHNDPPVIIKVMYTGRDLIDEGWKLSLPYQQGSHQFEISIIEPQDQEFTLDITASLGTLSDIESLGEGRFSFSWNIPDAPEGVTESIGSALDMTTSDIEGNKKAYRLDVILNPVGQDDEQELESLEGLPPIENFSMQASFDYSGSVIENKTTFTGNIQIGDSQENLLTKGYLSFNIDDISALDTSQISRVDLRFDWIKPSIGRPTDISDTLVFKVFYYGESLDLQDFYDNGTVFTTADAWNFGGSIKVLSGDVLRDQFIKAIEDGRKWFQVSIALDGQSDGDDGIDLFLIDPKAIYLDIYF